MDIQCCKCHRTRQESGWEWSVGLSERRISFSYCPDCLREFRREAGLAPRERVALAPIAAPLAFACG